MWRLLRCGSAVFKAIGAPGFEPGTSPTRTARATRLRHAPITVESSRWSPGWASPDRPGSCHAPTRRHGVLTAEMLPARPHPAGSPRPAMPHIDDLIADLDALLEPSAYRDYGPNGLQVPGCADVTR